jgi:hypothetical protein
MISTAQHLCIVRTIKRRRIKLVGQVESMGREEVKRELDGENLRKKTTWKTHI